MTYNNRLYVTLYITAWKTPVAAITVYSAPDDGYLSVRFADFDRIKQTWLNER